MIPFPDKKYNLIYADPPWLYDNQLGGQAKYGAATSAYPCMSVAELSALPVKSIVDPESCAIVMWTTGPKQREAHEVLTAWGFRYVTIYYVWVKLRSGKQDTYPIGYSDIYYGRGQYTRPNAEFAFLGMQGRVPPKYELGIPQVAHFRVGAHSTKPELFRRGLEHMWGPCNRIELFARERASGWDAWGNEI